MKGKIKELFEKWYVINNLHDEFFLKDAHQSDFADYFEDLTPTFKWGVMQDFYDSQGYDVTAHDVGCYGNTLIPNDKTYESCVSTSGNKKIAFEILYTEQFKTRQEARAAALEKAEQILEEKL